MLSARWASLGLLLLGTTALSAEPFKWDVPDALETVEVPETLSAEGIPVRLQMVRSKRSVEELAEYYGRAFQKAGLYLPRPEFRVKMFAEPSLTAIDPERKRSYTVILQAHPDRTTTVLMGEADVAARQGASPPEAPLVPGATAVVQTRGEGSATITYRAPHGPDAVASFYRELLPKEGWKELAPGRFRKQRRELSISASQAQGGSQVLVIHRGVAELDSPKGQEGSP